MRHAGGQQSDGTELVGLHQLALEFGTVRDVVEENDAADLLAVFRNQGRDGNIQDGLALNGRRHYGHRRGAIGRRTAVDPSTAAIRSAIGLHRFW